MTEYSGLAGGMNSSRFNSRSACAMTSAGGLASSRRLRKLRDLLVRAGFAFAQFALDRFELLAQISSALRVGKLRLHILLQLLLDLRDLELRRDVRLHRAQAFLQIEFLQNRLLLRATSTFRFGARKSTSCSGSSMLRHRSAPDCSGASGVSSRQMRC